MSLPRRLFLVAISVAVLAGCGPQVPPAQNYGVIQGRAYDSATGQGVAGVAISAFTIYNVVTGSDGSYRIANAPPGSFTLQVQPPGGYVVPAGTLNSLSGSIALGQTITLDIPLTKQ